MKIKIYEADQIDFDLIKKIYSKSSESLPYQSVSYLKTICKTLKAKLKFLIFKMDNGSYGYIPIIDKKTKYGNISNSLPFFGSIGSTVYDNLTNKLLSHLLRHIDEYNIKNEISAYCYISNPINKTKIENKNFEILEKISQITYLPKNIESITNFSFFDSRVKRNIKKAIKNNIIVHKVFFNDENLNEFYNLHLKSMKFTNGTIKPKVFFTEILKNLNKNEYSLYFAYKKEKKISALLLLINKNIIEYFIPCTLPEFRNLQPSSLIIYKAMADAVNNKNYIWNWGGTNKNQKNLYQFKKKWGGIDHIYYNIYKVYDPKLIKVSNKKILDECYGFFIKPF